MGEPRLTLLLDELSDALGDDARAVATGQLQRYAEPARGPAGDLDLVLLPGSTEQLRVMIQWARTHRISLIPQGANSGLVEASTPGPGDAAVVISTDRLIGEIYIDPVDRTVIAPAGVRLSTLNEALAAHGLRLPIDLGADPSIGGMAATNTGGARMIRHGDMRRHVLGIEAVLADEDVSLVDEISTLRKDNSGLSLTQLLVGSGGSLGVITRVALEVEPIAPSAACAWLLPVDVASAVDALVILESRWGTHLSAFEVVSNAALDAAVDHVADLRRPFPSSSESSQAGPSELSILVEFESLEPELAGGGSTDAETHLLNALAALHEQSLVTDAVLTPLDDAWRLRHSISEGLRHSGTIIGFDVSVPRSQLPAFRKRARHSVAAEFPRVTVADFGHWGDGGIHCSVIVPVDQPLSESERSSLRNLVFGIAVDEFGGSFSAEHGVGPINADWWRRSESPGSQRMSHAIKAACDPLGILGHPRMPY